MKNRFIHFFLLLFCCTFCLAFSLNTRQVYAAEFYYEANNDNLGDVLCAFANANNLGCELSPELENDTKLTISGNIFFETPDRFYSFMERNQNIMTYNNGSSIYFCKRSEIENALFTLQNSSSAQVSSTLKSMGLLDKRYPLQAASGGTLIRLTAPVPYIDIVTQVIQDIEMNATSKKGVRVFKLKHAWADDIVLDFMNSEVTIPGVATLLRNITSEMSAPSPSSRALPTVNRLGGQGLVRSSGTQQAQPLTQNMQETDQRNLNTRILADPRLNAVIIWDDEEKIPFYEALIQELDMPVGLIEIRVAIIDVSVGKSQELGLAWNVSTNIKDGVPQEGFGSSGGINVGNTDNFMKNLGSGINMTTIFTGGLDVFMARVKALETTGDATVLSRPAVLTMDNIQAVLENTETFYVEIAGKDTVDLFDVSYGTILRVTPHIVTSETTGKTMIKLVVYVEDGGSSATPEDYGTKLPTVTKTTITTQALVAENQTLIIGGHYKEVKKTDKSGVPILMNVPLLGRLFKTDTKSSQVKERIFVISPRIVDPNALPEANAFIAESMEKTMQNPKPIVPKSGCTRQPTLETPPNSITTTTMAR